MRKDLYETVDSSRALQILKDGNKRYVSGESLRQSDFSGDRSALAEKGQRPFAVIFGCSDSRLPPEIVFDLGIGQLFVVRTAGNVADAISIGSVEFAVASFGASLVVVLGHDKCGAVVSAINGGEFGPNIGAIISEIMPSLEKVRKAGGENIACLCENESIRSTVERLGDSPILAQYVQDKKLAIMGAKYNLATGEVDFDF